MILSLKWIWLYMKNGAKKNKTDSKLVCYHNRRVKPVLTLRICGVSQQCMCSKIFYLKIKIHGQLINIKEVTNFHNGFLTIFSALRSNTRWTTEFMNIHIWVENIDNFMGFFNNILL